MIVFDLNRPAARNLLVRAIRAALCALLVPGLFAQKACAVAEGVGRQNATRFVAQAPVDYARPAREYVPGSVSHWTVHVEKQLVDENPELAQRAQERLEKKLALALAALPELARPRLHKLEIYLMYGPKSRGGGRNNGLEYYQKIAPDFDPHIDPHWRDCIVIYSANNYARLSDLWALKALVHELAHAYQLQRWPEDQPDILQAWKLAMKRDLYHRVKDDEGKTIDKAYAAVNQLEYFAELSCMYFARCNYRPFDRSELKAYDPQGFAMIEKMWGISGPPPPATRQASSGVSTSP